MNISHFQYPADDCVLFGGEDSHLKILEQQVEEGNSSNGSEISLNGKDLGGMTSKQERAQEKLSRYQKSW